MKRTIFILLGLLTAVCGFSQTGLQPAAIINLIRTEAITVNELRSMVQQYEQAQGRALTQSERLQVLEAMIGEKLILQAAERDRVVATVNEVNSQLRASLAEQIGRQPTNEEYESVLRENNIDLEQARQQLTIQNYILNKKGAMINNPNLTPTEAEIATYYNLNRSEFIRQETIRVSRILVPYGFDAAARTRARTLVDSLYREINNDPAKFDEVAARGNESLGYIGGDSGYLPRSAEGLQSVGQQFMDIAFNLRQGQVSQVIEGLDGFQIIKVTENYSFAVLQLSDVIYPGQRATVRDYIQQGLLYRKQQEAFILARQELINEERGRAQVQVLENNIRW